jgi:tetratricopeptide (TPR) repeat protein
MNPANSLESIYFINFPEDVKLSEHALQIDPSVPLPVQKKEKDDPDNFNPKDISPEQILSGILTVLAYDKNNKNADYYRKIIKQARPNILKELTEAAILKTKNEEWDLAEEIFLAVKGIDPEDKRIYLNLALFFDQKADSYRKLSLYDDADAYDDSALRYYTDAMNSEPEIPEAFFNAGFFYLKQNNFAEAKGCFENYLALTADLTDEEMGDDGLYRKERAQELINKINERNLDQSQFNQAYKLISSGEEEKGLEVIRKFIENNPAVWNAWFLLGWGLRRLERFQEAKMAFEKAKECEGDDENADTLNELAICQMETGDFEGAVNSLNDALSMDVDNVKVVSNLGEVYLRMGKKDEARKYFKTALELDPNDKIARFELDRLGEE